MKCQACLSENAYCIDSREVSTNARRRRYKCTDCGHRFSTIEVMIDGHIGFNEPQTSFNSRTHIVELSEQTRIDNGRFFDDQNEVPTHAITMGIQDILNAKEIILVATGSNKTEIMAQLFASAIDEALPASALKQHKNLTIVLDREAAALLPEQALKNAV